MTFVPELLRVSKEIEPILTGGLLIFLVIFLPGGILSVGELISSIRRIFQKKNRTIPEGEGEHE
jgi:hypothetical protein